MSSEKVWSRFEAKKKDGTVLKLRIQDIPQNRLKDAVEVFMKYFFAEEILHKAVGITNDAESFARYKEILTESLKEPLSSIVICCADEDQVKDIMGLSVMLITDSIEDGAKEIDKVVEEYGTPLLKKLNSISKEYGDAFDPMKEYGLNKFYEDRGLCVATDYRGLGIAQQLLNVRTKICKAHGIPMTGAWMTAYGTQTAATRDGWKTVKEISYQYLGKKHGLTFSDAPPTVKFMIPDEKKKKSTLKTRWL